MAAKAFARPEQTQSSLEIIRNALRAAALAPSDRAALDVAGARAPAVACGPFMHSVCISIRRIPSGRSAATTIAFRHQLREFNLHICAPNST